MNYQLNQELIPAIVQDHMTRHVLMLGYMNQEAFDLTRSSGKVTFWSRSRKRLWTKGEESGHFLYLVDWRLDCDQDTLLVRVKPQGPTCHKGTDTCWAEDNSPFKHQFLAELEEIIQSRKDDPIEGSYTSMLFDKGINKIAQKVGEETTELIIESKDHNDHLFLEESADLLFHFLVLLRQKEKNLQEVVDVLKKRHR